MSSSDPDFAEQLEQLRADYETDQGKPFEHFYCPILFCDEQTKLCKGHVVNQALPNSTRLWVVQRADVDGFFGRVFESDMVAMVTARDKPSAEILFDKNLSKKMQPRLVIDGEPVRHYYDSGHDVPMHHTPVEFRSRDKAIPIVLCKPADELGDINSREWGIDVRFDSRTAGLVSILKAAHLTLFRLLRYSYGLSAAGIHVGKDILGSFFQQYHARPDSEARAAGRDHFKQYVNMVRPLRYAGKAPPRGTVEDGRLGVCVRPDKKPFGIIVLVRTIDHLHAVLLPAFDHVDSVVAYLRFMESDQTTLPVATGYFDQKQRVLKVEERIQELDWVKEDPDTALAD